LFLCDIDTTFEFFDGTIIGRYLGVIRRYPVPGSYLLIIIRCDFSVVRCDFSVIAVYDSVVRSNFFIVRIFCLYRNRT